MARVTTRYVCTSCGYQSAKPLGRCPNCQAWNSFEEEAPVVASGKTRGSLGGGYGGVTGGRLTPLSTVGRREEPRTRTGIAELDRVLGGGLVAGGVTLIGGEPGIGKSTLLLQVADRLARNGGAVLYVAGEESLEQIRLRADRLGVTAEIQLTRDTRAEHIAALMAEHKPALCIVDSIQTVTVEGDGTPGGLAQVREGTALLTRAAKETGTATVLVGHVTKEGTVAGPKVMEHIVDTTVFLETVGAFRLLRSVKNRFGQAGELGVFEMRGEGLVAVENPSAAFLAERPVGVPGSVVAATIDGQRPMLLEVQALAAKTPYPNPRRVVVGLDPRRVDVVLAVLERRLDLTLGGLDVYVNLAGGLKVPDPGLDLPVALAVYSAVVGRALPGNVAVFGEVGLAGEVRSTQGALRRAEEAARAGYLHLIVPPGLDGREGVRSVEEAVGLVWQPTP
ncbi:DNA repair protein RadA [Deinococcus metallilatus]|uniref:DNA repair protein RadA n=1 Tax=Deinococcus metallilatus TaxID=1211322 RepID=A0AAJ5JYM5_9DEIO|nr:DNA repair protein RadA [Deinococcus metallilatus]MBB5294230.1 DNA repair protein RadA/Sms [Deinococcus metallilatus]QBY09006.1 DNA repair protein RadA [Deinococcus metallilatus]RXJ10150.1 DNA repair protein RadA [Deinococcus metallilatus]TLK27913.1 DNA repair protein RadA [Deinococcus metallilatus]GMA16433.1 DNA repair protein RadA [Deinococcus metallilatus]